LPDLTEGVLVRRYKRFLADVRLADGAVVIAHTSNTGRMTGCADPGSRVWLSHSDNPKRKLAWTWELVEVTGGTLLDINPIRANRVAEEGVRAGVVPQLAGFESIRREVRLGDSRTDLLLEGPGRCWVEVKNVTLVDGRTALFPDAPTARGRKHLADLTAAVQAGDRAALLHLVLRGDVDRVAPADAVDPDWGGALRAASAAGVEVLACRATLSTRAVLLDQPLPVIL